MSDKQGCAGLTRRQGRSGDWRMCYNPGTIVERGQWWCHTHVPSRVESRTAARQAAANEHTRWLAEQTRLRAIELDVATVRTFLAWLGDLPIGEDAPRFWAEARHLA